MFQAHRRNEPVASATAVQSGCQTNILISSNGYRYFDNVITTKRGMFCRLNCRVWEELPGRLARQRPNPKSKQQSEQVPALDLFGLEILFVVFVGWKGMRYTLNHINAEPGQIRDFVRVVGEQLDLF